MYKPISKTCRCNLLQEISSNIWSHIICAHRVNADVKEVGITSDIIIEILNFNLEQVPNFDIYVKPRWNENIYGSDIDLFVETNLNQYRWFALQAKVLKKNNRYTTLHDSSDGIMQWEKLQLLEAVSGCKGYYLLYNGKDSFSNQNFKDCRGTYFGDQFGCSLVEPSIIQQFAETKIGGRYVSPTFEQIHPKHAIPWRMLSCCNHSITPFSLYGIDQIKTYNPNLILFEKSEEEMSFNNIEPIEFNKNNEIALASNEANWKPDIKIVIKRTDNFI